MHSPFEMSKNDLSFDTIKVANRSSTFQLRLLHHFVEIGDFDFIVQY